MIGVEFEFKIEFEMMMSLGFMRKVDFGMGFI